MKQIALVPEIWHGNHNRFILFFNKRKISRANVVSLCKEYKVDGLLILKIDKDEIYMKFFNPDGSKDNCGNGLRVAAFVCHKKRLVKNAGAIHSFGESFRYKIKDKEATIEFSKAKKIGNKWNIGGVIHKVISVDSIEQFKTKAQALRKKHLANITFIKKVHQGVFAQTFEMGVEGFTAACGTGSIAAALETEESRIFMPGGLLKVERINSGISLTGKVERVA